MKKGLLFFSFISFLVLLFWVSGNQLSFSINNVKKGLNNVLKNGCLHSNHDILKIGDTIFTFNDSLITTERHLVSINDILENKNLVFIASRFNCQACVGYMIEDLNNFFSKEYDINIIIITLNYQYRDFLIFKNAHPTTFPVYNILTEHYNYLENNIDPVFLLISENGKILKFHIPDKEHQDETLLFLKTIKQDFI